MLIVAQGIPNEFIKTAQKGSRSSGNSASGSQDFLSETPRQPIRVIFDCRTEAAHAEAYVLSVNPWHSVAKVIQRNAANIHVGDWPGMKASPSLDWRTDPFSSLNTDSGRIVEQTWIQIDEGINVMAVH
jgi:hypothetical protein